MSQNIAGLSPRSLHITTNISHMILCIQYKKYADLFTITSIKTAHKKKQKLPT
jgi:hypothetical protein